MGATPSEPRKERMTLLLAGIVFIPGLVALLLFAVFTYLYRQSRGQGYFRCWQIAWGLYCLHFLIHGLEHFGHKSNAQFLASRLMLMGVAVCISVSTRLVAEDYRPQWCDVALAALGVALCAEDTVARMTLGPDVAVPWLGVGIAVVLLYSGWRFDRHGRDLSSLGHRILGGSLALWSLVFAAGPFHRLAPRVFASTEHIFAPLPQVLVGLAMVMVLYENERRAVQQNTLAFSSLDIDSTRVLPAAALVPAFEAILQRLLRFIVAGKGAICIGEAWRAILPSVQHGFCPMFLDRIQARGVAEYLSEMAYREGGVALIPNVDLAAVPLPGAADRFEAVRDIFKSERASSFGVVSLRTRDRDFGALVFICQASALGQAFRRTLAGLVMQLATTLENYVLMHDAQRRTKEYELLTEIGQAISARLDPDHVLRTVHQELGKLFDTETFYVAFVDGDEVKFEFRTIAGELQPKRSRRLTNGLTEWVIRSGRPLLVRNEMEKFRARIGVAANGKPALCYCAAPILMGGKAAGVIAALNYEREFVYTERDLELMQTAAGQVAVAIENARLFAQEQRRAHYLEFLHDISKRAISSQDAELMLCEIVGEIQKTFHFDHIGIGVVDYATKEVEIKAEAGTAVSALGRRLPLGMGAIGRAARSNETALVQDAGAAGHHVGILPDARPVLCIPLSYGETLLGVLNIENRRENAFPQQDVLALNMLADLLATALHNAFVFQKMQQQSITDGLTGIKTRRYFLEALQSEWKRASRSGRPFSVVMVDLDQFKQVNDSLGHLEGDLVLARVGRLLEQKCRHSNVVARYGGDEFIILMPETGLEQAQVLAERLRVWLATDPMLNERRITGSFGLGAYPLHGATAEEVLRVADAGMYVSKHAGGNCVSTAEEMGEPEPAVMRRQLLAAYIEGFLQRQQTGPESVDELVATLNKLSDQSGANAESMKNAVIALTSAAETREFHSAGHGEHVARYVEALARDLALPPQQIADLVFAARVHDVGKIVIPEKILTKEAPLTPDEMELMKTHPAMSARIVAAIPGSDNAARIVRHHHERFDGSGYPDGLSGEQIPVGARILALADSFAAMTEEHSYAPALSSSEALAKLEQAAGTQLDPALATRLQRLLAAERATHVGE